MSIAVEDWDELADGRRRRAERTPEATLPAAAEVDGGDDTVAVVAELRPEPTPGVADFADDDYGYTTQNLRVPAGIAGANVLIWLVGLAFGVVELIGVAFFVSVGLLLASYLLRQWQRDRTALVCLAGALPLPLTIVGLFT